MDCLVHSSKYVLEKENRQRNWTIAFQLIEDDDVYSAAWPLTKRVWRWEGITQSVDSLSTRRFWITDVNRKSLFRYCNKCARWRVRQEVMDVRRAWLFFAVRVVPWDTISFRNSWLPVGVRESKIKNSPMWESLNFSIQVRSVIRSDSTRPADPPRKMFIFTVLKQAKWRCGLEMPIQSCHVCFLRVYLQREK